MSDNSKLQKNAELVFAYIYNNRLVIIFSFVLVFAILAGILIYKSSITKQDFQINNDFEASLTIYNIYKNSPTAQENNPTMMADLITRFQKVYSSAKGKKLKLRAAYALASVYYDLNNFEEASKYYKEVSASRGFYLQESAMYNLANTYIDLKKYKEAISTLEAMVKLYSDSYLTPQATLNLADVYLKEQNRVKSINVLKTWISENTNNTHYLPIFTEALTLIENNIY